MIARAPQRTTNAHQQESRSISLDVYDTQHLSSIYALFGSEPISNVAPGDTIQHISLRSSFPPTGTNTAIVTLSSPSIASQALTALLEYVTKGLVIGELCII